MSLAILRNFSVDCCSGGGSARRNLLSLYCSALSAYRQKSKKAAFELHDDNDDGLGKDYKLKTVKCGSRRLDVLAHKVTGKTTAYVKWAEQSIY